MQQRLKVCQKKDELDRKRYFLSPESNKLYKKDILDFLLLLLFSLNPIGPNRLNQNRH